MLARVNAIAWPLKRTCRLNCLYTVTPALFRCQFTLDGRSTRHLTATDLIVAVSLLSLLLAADLQIKYNRNSTYKDGHIAKTSLTFRSPYLQITACVVRCWVNPKFISSRTQCCAVQGRASARYNYQRQGDGSQYIRPCETLGATIDRPPCA